MKLFSIGPKKPGQRCYIIQVELNHHGIGIAACKIKCQINIHTHTCLVLKMYNNYFWVKKKLFPEEIVSSTTVFNINNKRKVL